MEKLKVIKNYYNDKNAYLKEHADFFSKADIKKEVKFLKSALDLQKSDTILDIACGQGRHSNYLAAAGYHVDGVDFSNNLLKLAKEKSFKTKNRPHYFLSNILNFHPKHKYRKAYWLFADLAQMEPKEIAFSLKNIVSINGTLLLDFDNLFRLTSAMAIKNFPNLYLDVINCRLHDKKIGISAPYLTILQWKEVFQKHGFTLINCYGNYGKQKYELQSPRMIMKFKKTA